MANPTPPALTRPLLPLLLALSLAGCNLSHVATRAIEHQARRDDLVEHREVLGARQIRYWMGGDGPPLLLLHGFGGDGLTTWDKQLHDLSATHTLIVPDLLWFGDSSAVGLSPTLHEQARAMSDLLDQLGIGRADVMGISYGGFVAMMLQQDHPEHVDRLIMVDSPGPVFGPQDQADMLSRLGVTDPAQMFVPETNQDVARLIALVRPKGPAIPGFVLTAIRKDHFSSNHVQKRALLADLVSLDGAFPPDTWTRPRSSLVVWGEDDPVFPLATGQALADALHAELRVVADAAHGPNYQHPREFNAAVLSWLDGAPVPKLHAAPPAANPLSEGGGAEAAGG